MSISGVSASLNVAQMSLRNDFQQIRDTFKSLGAALQSGDLDGAKKAYGALDQAMRDLQGRGSNDNNSPSKANSSIANDMKALDEALQSGDMDAAKQAFDALKKDMRGARHAHHHHHHKRPDNDGDEQGAANTTTPPPTSDNANTTNTALGQTLNVTA